MDNLSRRDELKKQLASYRKRSKNPILEKLLDAMEEKNILPTELLEITGLTRETLFSSKGHLPSDPNKLKPLPAERAALFYMLLKLKPEDMLLEPEPEKRWLMQFPIRTLGLAKNREKASKSYFTDAFWQSVRAQWPQKDGPYDDFFPIIYTDQMENEKLLHAYRETKDYFTNAKHYINVQELLFKGNNIVPMRSEAYKKAQSMVHKAIIDALKRHQSAGTEFRYERICYLSPSERLYSKGTTAEAVKRAFMAEASVETLEHLIKCLQDSPEYCRFTVVVQSSIFRHRVLIDDHYMITEDYVCDGNDKIVPERIYTLDVSSKHKGSELIAHERNRIRKDEAASRSFKLSIPDFGTYLGKAKCYAKEEIDSRETVLQYLQTLEGDHSRLRDRLDDTCDRYKMQVEMLDKKLDRILKIITRSLDANE